MKLLPEPAHLTANPMKSDIPEPFKLSARQKPLRSTVLWRGIDNSLARLPASIAPRARRQARRLRRGLRRLLCAHVFDSALPPGPSEAVFLSWINRIDRLNRTGSRIQITYWLCEKSIQSPLWDLPEPVPPIGKELRLPTTPASGTMSESHHPASPLYRPSAKNHAHSSHQS